jgi:hypothetical protein
MSGDFILQRKVPRYDQRTVHHNDSNCNLDARSKEFVQRIAQATPQFSNKKLIFFPWSRRREKNVYYGNMMTDPRIWRGNTYSMYREQKLEAAKVRCFPVET